MIKIGFEELFTFDNLYKAHIKGRVSKRSKRPVVRYEISLSEKIKELHSQIITGKYKVGRYNSFIIFEPKQREIQTLHYSDRIVQHVICDNVIAPYFTKRAIMDNGVCQIGKGTHFTLKRFEYKLHQFIKRYGNKGYILKCDVFKYFPSVPHKQLKETILPHFRDKRLRDFMEMIIDSYHTHPEYLKKYDIPVLCKVQQHKDNGKMWTTGRGIPIGNQTSQIFGMFYLNKLDRFIKENLRIKIYSRYMDDFVIVHNDKEYLKEVLAKIQQIVGELGLTLNKKTKIFPLKNGVTYLGFRYQVTETGKVIKKVSKKTVVRFKARARLINRAYADGIINLDKVQSCLSAYHGHLKHGNCFKLEQNLFKRIKVAEIYKSQKEKKNGKQGS